MSKGRQKFNPPTNDSKPLAPHVCLIAGPLGNVGDITLRALERIKAADLVFCEDTRKFRQLCSTLEIDIDSKTLQSLPGQREVDFEFSKFLNYSRWIFMSDAGSPLVNDPGMGLIVWAKQNNILVEALPGPSAPILLWQWSGGFGLPFVFGGFVPKTEQASELEAFFTLAQKQGGSFCFFDTKYQVLSTLEFLSAHPILGQSKIYAGREMTKTYEELIQGSAAELHKTLKAKIDANEGVGELTFILQATQGNASQKNELNISELAKIRNSPPKEAAKIISKLTGKNVRDCYDLLVNK